jgi:hypothetical protein
LGAVQFRKLVVAQHAVVEAAGTDEVPVARRREADDFVVPGTPCTLAAQQVRQPQGRLARCAGQYHASGAEEIVVGEEVVEQERGGEQGSQQHLQVFARQGIERVPRAAQVLVVDDG